MFDLGDTVRLSGECRDPGGTLTDATTVALTITLPDGTTASPLVANPPASTGTYSVDYVTEQPGQHAVRWVWTGPAAAYTDSFDVREALPPLVLSLADARAHLNLTGSGQDTELRGWMETVTECVESLAGPCARRTVTEVHRHLPRDGARTIALRTVPALTLTSVQAVLTGGVSYDTADLDLDGGTGIVQRLDGQRLSGPLRVTYVAGRAVVPPSIRDAAKIILKHLWRTQLGTSRGPVVGGGDDFLVTEPVPGFGYAIPNRALQLLEPHRLPPGVG